MGKAIVKGKLMGLHEERNRLASLRQRLEDTRLELIGALSALDDAEGSG